ncbi:phytoene desaturase family protein [Arsenicicoccus sp. oral taxon 190]|uniref:phytoene desaturase family protein n=1 Tax=Arsenicicoccus sp. oral taxon 190 TaxID=1658671 RepID=UPI00067A2C17|nr:NAD(P)/FAD-dependent oxidoreductase [Arsenicicoccus sp. oral taxon 190]AKT50762.1 FAD-dependent oxidoreductase [Arsenicicoccus sp. oral taxon 190]
MTTSRSSSPSRSAGPVETVDAVVVGGGHHGLVAASTLADAGWDVLVLEARDTVGGAVASRDVDGWVLDEFSACHPLGAVSPVLRELDLEQHGLSWCHAPRPVVHVAAGDDTEGSVVQPTAEETAALLDQDHAGDGESWLRLCRQWEQLREPLLAALLTRWPPVRSLGPVLARVGATQLPDFVRFAMLPVDRMGVELFGGARGGQLLAGNAMHADIPPEAPGSGLFGWLMTMLAQDVGFPSPRGGTRALAQALRARAEQAGARVETGQLVTRIALAGGRAHGVETADGRRIRARRAVIADTSAPDLYERLLPQDAIPVGLRSRLDRFAWDLPTLKLNYRLAAPMPWTARHAHGAAVVHAGQDRHGLVRWSADLGSERVPERPFALVGQMTTIDPTRSPDGTEALWLYTHLPRGVTDPDSAARLTEGCEAMFDDLAPGWRDHVIDRWDQTPRALHDSNANLGEGAVGGGTMQLWQQAIWRPVTGLGGPRTHVDGLYLGSAATHPGGGVHGGCGYLAARAALADQAWWGRPARHLSLATLHRLYAERPTLR